jgi:hypothetical protein
MPCLFVGQNVYLLLRAYNATCVASPVRGRPISEGIGV